METDGKREEETESSWHRVVAEEEKNRAREKFTLSPNSKKRYRTPINRDEPLEFLRGSWEVVVFFKTTNRPTPETLINGNVEETVERRRGEAKERDQGAATEDGVDVLCP